MTKVEYIDILEKEAKGLTKREIEEVLDFIGYLKRKEEEDASKEILANKKFMKSIKKGLEDLRAGRTYSWKKLEKNV